MTSTSFYALIGEFSKKLTDLQKREQSMHEMDKSVEPEILENVLEIVDYHYYFDPTPDYAGEDYYRPQLWVLDD